MFLNLADHLKASPPREVRTIDLATAPGSQIMVKKLSLEEYLMSRDDLREVYAELERKNKEAKDNAKEGEVVKEQTFLAPNAVTIAYSLVTPEGKRVFEGYSIHDALKQIAALPIDMYTEIAKEVEDVNANTFERIETLQAKQKADKEAELVAKKLGAVASETSTA